MPRLVLDAGLYFFAFDLIKDIPRENGRGKRGEQESDRPYGRRKGPPQQARDAWKC